MANNDAQKPSTNATGAEASAAKGIPKKLLDTITLVRAKMRDYPELNRLIEGHETSDREIAFAIMEVWERWSQLVPRRTPLGLTGPRAA